MPREVPCPVRKARASASAACSPAPSMRMVELLDSQRAVARFPCERIFSSADCGFAGVGSSRLTTAAADAGRGRLPMRVRASP